jgi:hypothetical protein
LSRVLLRIAYGSGWIGAQLAAGYTAWAYKVAGKEKPPTRQLVEGKSGIES